MSAVGAVRPLPRRHVGLTLATLAAVLIAALMAGVSAGSVRIPLDEVWAIVAHRIAPSTVQPWWSAARESIVLDSRLPRALLTAVVGAALALGGAIAQAVTRNPLADPYLLGVSSGAGFGVVTVTILGIGAGSLGALTIPAAAFLGGLLPLLAVMAIVGRHRSIASVVLAGVALAQIFQALITFLLLVVADVQELSGVLHWMAGGFGDASWELLPFPLFALAFFGVVALAGGRWMNLLHAGDDGAAALGMNVRRFRMLMLAGVSLLAGSAVAVAGGIGFIGLIVPHAASYLVGASAHRLLPTAALLGATALVLAETAARSVSTRIELPVGVVTALVGAPIFIIMLYRQHRRAS